MEPLTEAQVRTAFVNTSKREAAEASVPDLAALEWDRLEVLGWTDARRPGISYVVLERDGEAHGIMLRPAATSGARKKAVCGWCEDVTATENVVMFVARRAGAAGRKGDTVGTLICADFACSKNVRRAPSLGELGAKATPEERAYWQAVRIEGLQERSLLFLDHVLRADDAPAD